MSTPVLCNVGKWIEENQQFFLPPVCNKLMHGGQSNVMFVGGPNNRKDYHIEGGEELFLQLKGDMQLKVVERNEHKDINIREGELFLLHRAIPHSPQRFADTVGLVMERNRLPSELDALRFYVSENGTPTTVPLFEAWFQWNDNRARMAEFFDEFFASEQCKTGKPKPGTIPEKSRSPIEVDTVTSLQAPFSLKDWIANNRQRIDADGKMAIFDCSQHQLQVFVYGKGENTDYVETAETWIWQLEGQSQVTVGTNDYTLTTDDSLLVPIGQRFSIKQEAGSISFVCYQIPLVN